MAAFRRCVIALAVLAVFAGLASAQVMTCSVTSQQGNINLRSESKSELISDLLITCTSTGVNATNTLPAPVVNVTVTFNAPVTSKIVQTSGGYNVSESLLLIDDPQNSGTAQVANYGTGATQVACSFLATGQTGAPTASATLEVPGAPLNGCNAFPNIVGGIPVMSNTGSALGSPTTGAANMYEGIASGNSLQFFGVPVVPPGTNSTRTYRITNVRVNANQTAGQIFGSISVQAGAGPGTSGAGQFAFLTTVSPTLGTSTTSLSVKGAGAPLNNCNPFNYTFAGTVSFTEILNNAFKTRVVATAATQFSGQSSTSLQNIPGAFNGSSESDFVPALAINSVTPGLADFGTRLKAVFSNIPSGMRIFVSFTSVTGANAAGGVAGVVNATFFTGGALTAAAGSNTPGTFAALLQQGAEATPDGATGPPLVTPLIGTSTTVGTGIPYFELPVSSGTATGIWEVLNNQPSATETQTFNIWIIGPAQTTVGTVSGDLTYAPTTSTSVTPNFFDPGTTTPIFSIGQCRTILLYPYVTSAGGFDTGIAVANTTADPLGTAAQTGTCAVTLYGGPSPVPTLPAAVWNIAGTTGLQSSIPSGQVGAFSLLGASVSGFTGYAIAVCNFQFAHGFAFVADWGAPATSSAMGYLALILNSVPPRIAPVGGESLGE